MPIPLFFCYAREDEALLHKLKTHLRPLERQGFITIWDDRDINAGTPWEQEIKQHLEAAQIILLLVSADFMASNYCYGIEMKRALERHANGKARVIPIILHPVYWHGEPLGKLQALPTDGKPITDPEWHNINSAFYDVTQGIQTVVEQLTTPASALSVGTEALPLALEEQLEMHSLYGHTRRVGDAALRANGKILVNGNLSIGRRLPLLGLAGLVSIVLVILLVFVPFFPRLQFPGSITPTSIISTSRPGSITEFVIPTHESGPGGITAGPDNNLWFTELKANKIGRITPEGIVTEFVIPTHESDPAEITVGPDNNLWFTELKANKIGRITPEGIVTEFVIPTQQSGAGGIATGPDGNLWFTEDSVSKIGRITLSGRITEFATPTSQSDPVEIIAGPDGSLWFTEYQANKIGRITPEGSITEFAIPTSQSMPAGITVGSDGNLWFTEGTKGNASKIGRITPSGNMTEFVLSTPGGTFRITTGRDGNLWFTEGIANMIGRITPEGIVTEFALLSQPGGIIAGPDGNLWFTEYYTNKIGRITSGK